MSWFKFWEKPHPKENARNMTLAETNALFRPIISDTRPKTLPQLHSAKVYANATQFTDPNAWISPDMVCKHDATIDASIMDRKRPAYILEVIRLSGAWQSETNGGLVLLPKEEQDHARRSDIHTLEFRFERPFGEDTRTTFILSIGRFMSWSFHGVCWIWLDEVQGHKSLVGWIESREIEGYKIDWIAQLLLTPQLSGSMLHFALVMDDISLSYPLLVTNGLTIHSELRTSSLS